MSAGTSSWVPRPTGPTIRTISRSTGAAGSTSAPAPRATWLATRSISLAWPSNCSEPESVEVIDTSGIVDHETYPVWSIIRTHFGPREHRGPLSMTWYDGGDKFPENKKVFKELLYGEKVPDSGLLLVGEKGSFFSQNDYGAEHVLLPREKFKDYQNPKKALPRSPGHFTEFVEAIKSGDPSKAMSNFGYAGRLTETVLLGTVGAQDRLEDRLGSRCPQGPELFCRRSVHPSRVSQGILDPLSDLAAH